MSVPTVSLDPADHQVTRLERQSITLVDDMWLKKWLHRSDARLRDH